MNNGSYLKAFIYIRLQMLLGFFKMKKEKLYHVILSSWQKLCCLRGHVLSRLWLWAGGENLATPLKELT